MPPGHPSTELYRLGSGILSIGIWSGATPPGSASDVGNCGSMEVEVTQEALIHKESRAGIHTEDKEVILLSGYTVNFILDEISVGNITKFLRGTQVGSNIIRANQAGNVEYSLEFVSNNPEGQNETWIFHRCTLSPNGAFNLIGEEFGALSFTAKGLSDTANNAASPYFTVTFATTTTTTTTT